MEYLMADTEVILAKLTHLEAKLDMHQADSEESRKEVKAGLSSLGERLGKVERFQSEISGGRKILIALATIAAGMAALFGLFKFGG